MTPEELRINIGLFTKLLEHTKQFMNTKVRDAVARLIADRDATNKRNALVILNGLENYTETLEQLITNIQTARAMADTPEGIKDGINYLRNIRKDLLPDFIAIIDSAFTEEQIATRAAARAAREAARAAEEEAGRREAERLAAEEAREARAAEEEAGRREAERIAAEEEAANRQVALRAQANVNRAPAPQALANALQPVQPQVHIQGQIQAWELDRLETIHRGRELSILRRKVPQQHRHNCWADSTFVVLLQSTPMNAAVWPLLVFIINNIIANDGGRIDGDLFRLEGGRPVVIERIAAAIRAVAPLTPPDINVFIFNIVRYIQKLFQIYEIDSGLIGQNVLRNETCPRPGLFYNPLDPGVAVRAAVENVAAGRAVASRHALAAQEAQAVLRPGMMSGMLADLTSGLDFVRLIMPNMGYKSLSDHALPVINVPPFIYGTTRISGYFIAINWEGRGVGIGHAMSLFISGTTWYFYDNSNYERIHQFTPDQSNNLSMYIISGLRIEAANKAEHNAQNLRYANSPKNQRVIITLNVPPPPAPQPPPIIINFGYYETLDTPTRQRDIITGNLNTGASFVFYNNPPAP